MLFERRLVPAQRLDHLRQELLGLLDLVLLRSHLFPSRRYIRTMPLNRRAGLLTALVVGRKTTLRGENPAFQGLHVVAPSRGLAIQKLRASAQARELVFQLEDFVLVFSAHFFVSLELASDLSRCFESSRSFLCER